MVEAEAMKFDNVSQAIIALAQYAFHPELVIESRPKHPRGVFPAKFCLTRSVVENCQNNFIIIMILRYVLIHAAVFFKYLIVHV
jgi:hypothetical protein